MIIFLGENPMNSMMTKWMIKMITIQTQTVMKTCELLPAGQTSMYLLNYLILLYVIVI